MHLIRNVYIYRMEMYHILLGISAFLIGFILRLIGGGGSILTVPILVYFVGLEPHLSTAYSLFIIGVSSLVASIQNARAKLIDFRFALLFAFPAFFIIFLIRKYLLPALPEVLIDFGAFALHKDTAIMVFFACVMLLSSVSMILGRKDKKDKENSTMNYPLIFGQGILVGCVTGLVGAGGGFLIIPAMVFFANMEMKKAVATSLFVIAFNSLFGFMGDVAMLKIDWTFLLSFSSLTILGIFTAGPLSKSINSAKLRKLFGWFILCMGIFIILKEIL